MTNHPRPGRSFDLLAAMFVRMVPMAVTIRMMTKIADVLYYLRLIRAALVDRLGSVTSHGLPTSNVRTGYSTSRRMAADRTSVRIRRCGNRTPPLKGSAGAAIVSI